VAKNQLTVDKSDLKKFIHDSIKEIVNGKIDRLNIKIDLVGEHLKRQDVEMAEVKPLLRTAQTQRILVRAGAWMFGTLMSMGAAYLLINQIVHTFPW
jgi:hypothetical protein